MLAQVSFWLSKNGYHVSVIGRNTGKMERLIEQNPDRMTPVIVDYTDTEKLSERLSSIQQNNGPVCLVVAWIHSTGPEVITCLTDSFPSRQSWKLFQVNGSSSDLKKIKTKAALPSHISYYQIQLGFQLENGISRWLTHAEISNGVIQAIQEEKDEQIVGTLTRWEKRPQK